MHNYIDFGKWDYRGYLQSPAWKARRVEALIRAGYKCEKCGMIGVKLEIHHKTYANIGNERPEDLEVLCERCHEGVNRGRLFNATAKENEA